MNARTLDPVRQRQMACIVLGLEILFSIFQLPKRYFEEMVRPFYGVIKNPFLNHYQDAKL